MADEQSLRKEDPRKKEERSNTLTWLRQS